MSMNRKRSIDIGDELVLANLLFLVEEHFHDALLVLGALQHDLVGELLPALVMTDGTFDHDGASCGFLDFWLFLLDLDETGDPRVLDLLLALLVVENVAVEPAPRAEVQVHDRKQRAE
jgi:hypothetical protein